MDDIDIYIQQYDPLSQKKLYQLRKLILELVPDAEEKLSWGVPTYNYYGFLVQFAMNKKHLGFYCSPSAIEHFKKRLSTFSTNNKNTIRFALNQDLPIELIKEIIQFRTQENLNQHSISCNKS